MLRKINLTYCLILIAILIVVVVWSGARKSRMSQGNFEVAPTKNIDTTIVTSMKIWPQYAQPTMLYVFQKTSDGWYITYDDYSYPVQQMLVSDLFKALLTIRTSRVVTNSEQDWPHYGLDADAGTRIHLFANDSLTYAFRIGGLAFLEREGSEKNVEMFGFDPDNVNTYVRFEGQPTVYMADNFFSYHFTRYWKEWIDTLRYTQPLLPEDLQKILLK